MIDLKQELKRLGEEPSDQELQDALQASEEEELALAQLFERTSTTPEADTLTRLGEAAELAPEATMQKLFDATAPELMGADLTRIAARAADIPAKNQPWWKSLKVWLPGMGVAAAAAVALAVVATPGEPADTAPSAIETAPAIVAENDAPPRTTDDLDIEIDDELDDLLPDEPELAADINVDETESYASALALPTENLDEDEVDVWLAALDDVFDEEDG